MHCFSGDADFARACLDRGAYLSFAGTGHLQAERAPPRGAAVTPLDRILIETDAPYLTPMPFRGRPNASYLDPAHRPVHGRVTGVGTCTEVSAGRWTTTPYDRLRRPLGRLSRWSSPRCCAAAGWCGATTPTGPVAGRRARRGLRRRLRAPSAGFTQGVTLLVLDR